MIKRVFANIILFSSLFFAPWWATVVVGVIFLFLFKKYWELIVMAILIDTLYYAPNSALYGRFGIFLAGAVILFFIVDNFKTKLRPFN